MRLRQRVHLIAPLLALLAGLLVASPAWADTYSPAHVPNPKATGNGYVSNPDGIVSAATVAKLDAMLAALERETGAQVAVVAIGNTDPADIFSFAQALFEHWGIGDKSRDDGLLILLVTDQRTVRLHTGYGLEGSLPDAVCKRIQEDFMVPQFKRGDYDAGLIAGVRQVEHILTQPDYAAQFVHAPDDAVRGAWTVFRFIALGILVFVSLIAFGVKSAYGYYSGSRRLKATPPAMRYTRGQWWSMALGGPALILLLCELLPLRWPVLTFLGVLYGYFLLLPFVQLRRQRHHAAKLYTRHNYTAITRFLRRQRGFWRWMAVLFPFPWAIYPLLLARRIAFYRNHPRQCTKCKQPMRRLAEEIEDQYLSSGHQVEEQIHAKDHDVWLCDACGDSTVRSFAGSDDDDFDKCPACKHLTYWQERDETLVEPTYTHGGSGERTHVCKHCGHREVISYAIGRLRRSSSSSSSGGSGGSWGGGSSGGGGSSSSW